MSLGLKLGTILVAVALVSFAGINQAYGERLPYEYFAKDTDYHSVKISPDGKFYGIRFDQEGTRVMVFIDRKKMKMSGGAKPLLRGHVNDFQWVNKERVIYTVATQDSYLDVPLNDGNLYGVNRNGSKHEVVFGFQAGANIGVSSSRITKREATRAAFSVINRLADDDKHILIAEYPYRQVGRIWSVDSRALTKVTRLNVYDGRKRELDVLPIPGSNALADNNGNVRVAIGSDENSDLLIKWKPDEDADWQKFDMTDAGIESPVPQSFTQDNQSIFISGQPENGGPNAIYKLNLADNTHEMVYQHELASVSAFMRDMHNDSVVAMYAEPGLPHYEYLVGDDNETVRLHKRLSKAFEGKRVMVTSHTDSGEEVIIFVYDSVNPGEYYLFNTKTNKAEFLFARSSWVDPRKLRPKQPVMITARDGLELPSYLTLPDDSDAPAPMVVLVHGGPHGPRDRWGYDREVQFLANRGYAVLQVNYRGSGGFGTNFITSGHGEWGGKMQDDLTDATQWAIEQGHADANRICIYGASYGGYAALMGAAKEPELYKCAIGYAGVYDLATMFEKGDIPEHRSGKGYLRKAVGTDPEKLVARSPLQQAANIKAKVLLVHGGNDVRVPDVHAKMMRDALQRVDNEPEWLFFESEGHGFYDVEHRIELYKKMEAFLDNNIGESAIGNQTVSSP